MSSGLSYRFTILMVLGGRGSAGSEGRGHASERKDFESGPNGKYSLDRAWVGRAEMQEADCSSCEARWEEA
jgi:hypothetical protein